MSDELPIHTRILPNPDDDGDAVELSIGHLRMNLSYGAFARLRSVLAVTDQTIIGSRVAKGDKGPWMHRQKN